MAKKTKPRLNLAPEPEVLDESNGPAPEEVKQEVTPVIPETKPVGDVGSYQSDALRTKAKLDTEPKVRTMIPYGINEKKGAYETVTINGYKYTIPKGVFVEVPVSVSKLIEKYLGMETEVKDQAIINNPKVQEALA